MKLLVTVAIALVIVLALPLTAAAAIPDLPAAIYTDPPDDPMHPALGQGIQFESHGALINAQLYEPPGAGTHPTVVLLHGLPGNEQNLDLAQAMRRAGWTVITFHYRGSWGSGGEYRLVNGAGDTEALLALLGRPEKAAAWGVDPSRIVLIGHSYGGYVAARVANDAVKLLGVALLAPWDISADERAWAQLPPGRRESVGVASFFDVNGRLSGATARSIFHEVMKDGAGMDLTRCAPGLRDRHLLIVTATRDSEADHATGLLAALNEGHAQHLTAALMDTDHGFNDHRIALESVILRWLAGLAPTPTL